MTPKPKLPTTSFDTLIDLARTPDGYRTHLTEDWMQGRSTFGGVSAAIAIAAMRRDTGDARPLRSIDIAFVGPLGPGAVDLTTEILREGRSATHASATLHTGGRLASRAHAVFGAARPSKIVVPFAPPKPSQPSHAVTPLPFIPGVTPAFTQHFEYRMCEGDLPFSRSSRATMGGYVRPRTTNGAPLGVEMLVAMTDAWPAPVLPMAQRPFPASTARMSVQLLEPLTDDMPDECWFHSECIAAGDGYATIVGRLYAGDTPLAWMEQLVALFDG